MRLTKHMRMLPVFLVALVALVLATSVRAYADDEDGRQIPFADVKIFFEFNSTDNDLGLQVFLDGKAWKRLTIEDPHERKILDIKAESALRELGLTELFFESAEPSPEEVLALFPAGVYEFEGRTVEGDELEGEATLSHELPPAPDIIHPAFPGQEVDSDDLVIVWRAIPGIASFEIIVDNETTGASMTVALPASATTLEVPEEFLTPDSEYKVEVLAIADNGNKTITEREFVTGE